MNWVPSELKAERLLRQVKIILNRVKLPLVPGELQAERRFTPSLKEGCFLFMLCYRGVASVLSVRNAG